MLTAPFWFISAVDLQWPELELGISWISTEKLRQLENSSWCVVLPWWLLETRADAEKIAAM